MRPKALIQHIILYITSVIGYILMPHLQCTISTPRGAFLAWYSSMLHYNGAGKFIHNHQSHLYRVPIYTPGSRAAMCINCLAEGQKCLGDGEIRTRALSVRVE